MPLNSIELRARIDSVLLADDFGISQWYGTGTSPLRLTYRFPTEKAPDSDFGYFGGLFAFNAAEKAAFRRAFDIFENVLNVEFVEDNFSYDVNFNFFRVGDLLPLDPSSTGIAAARWWHDRNGWDGDSFYQRGYDWSDPRLFHVILHEIGHMFGLKHPGPYDAGGNIPPGPYLPANEDNDRYTVMSYTTNSETGIPSTSLMLYDIAALQKFWGANMSPKTNVDEYTFSKNGPIQTIWDTQGIDTINHIVGPASVDLRPGGWSSLSGVERLAIAYGTTIENARTGSFADEVQGNSAHNRIDLGGGNDRAFGDDGRDTLLGGGGNDTLHGEMGRDLLHGGNQEDWLYGESGADTLAGDAGFDVLSGGDGDDTLYGGDQADNLYGGVDDDLLYGEQGFDRLFGGVGQDVGYGGDGSDGLFGELGDDQLFGEAGNDRFFGGQGNDVLDGGADGDNLIGGAGFDTLIGGGGNDTLSGKFNADTFVFADNFGQDTIRDFAATNDFERLSFVAVSTITDFADLADNHMMQVGADVVIDDLAGSTITLLNVALSDLDSRDFIL